MARPGGDATGLTGTTGMTWLYNGQALGNVTGVTGARKKLPLEVSSNVRSIKRVTDKPVAVGFGISDPKQARAIAKVADGVIVGSALVKIIGEKKNPIPRISSMAKNLAKAIHGE